MTEKETNYFNLRFKLATQIMVQNMQSGFSGKFEVWFGDGRILDIKNNQHFGVSINGNIDKEAVITYTDK